LGKASPEERSTEWQCQQQDEQKPQRIFQG
jgi:hypothetical protein